MKVYDFVIANKNINNANIVKNSVGIIKNISYKYADVYFIGKDIKILVKICDIDFLDVAQTGKGYKNKICNRCYILKDYYEDFDINQTDAKGIKTTRPSCKTCRDDIEGVKLSAKEKKRMAAIKPSGLYECPICHKKSIAFVTGNFVIDHNHKTGEARAWICDSCNTGLGRFKDDIEVFKNAIEYLKLYEKSK